MFSKFSLDEPKLCSLMQSYEVFFDECKQNVNKSRCDVTSNEIFLIWDKSVKYWDGSKINLSTESFIRLDQIGTIYVTVTRDKNLCLVTTITKRLIEQPLVRYFS